MKLFLAILLSLPLSALAQTQVPNVFEDGTPASAAEVNENFDALEIAIDSNDEDFELFRMETQLLLPPSNCSTNQIIKWSGSAWVCATDVLAGLSCAEGQTILYKSGAWRCGCVAPGAPIDQDNFGAAIADWRANGDDSIYGPISQWCTTAVTNMSPVFGASLGTSFNEDISGWDVSNVTNMTQMFEKASAFNQDLSN